MKVASFYRFLDITDPKGLQGELQSFCDERKVLGTILVAGEGFNGTLSGPGRAIRDVFGWIERRLVLKTPIEARWTDAGEAPFRRMRVRAKKEIVTLGRPDILPHRKTGSYVPPAEWNALIEDPDVLVVDTRNHYEVSGFCEAARGDIERPASGHVLHGRDPLREGDRVDARAGLRRGLSPAGRNTEVPRGHAGRRESLAGRVFRLRHARCGG
jgi:predicted sulfurtransferase